LTKGLDKDRKLATILSRKQVKNLFRGNKKKGLDKDRKLATILSLTWTVLQSLRETLPINFGHSLRVGKIKVGFNSRSSTLIGL